MIAINIIKQSTSCYYAGKVDGDEFLVVEALKNHELAAAFVDKATTNQVSDLEAMISRPDNKMYQVKHATHN